MKTKYIDFYEDYVTREHTNGYINSYKKIIKKGMEIGLKNWSDLEAQLRIEAKKLRSFNLLILLLI